MRSNSATLIREDIELLDKPVENISPPISPSKAQITINLIDDDDEEEFVIQNENHPLGRD